MKNRLSIKLSQKPLLTEKYTMSWENIPALLTCQRAKMPPLKCTRCGGIKIMLIFT